MIDDLWRRCMSPFDLPTFSRSLRPRGWFPWTPAIRTSAKSAAAVSVFFAAFLLAGEAVAQSIHLGSCTPGQRQCQAGELMQCECYDEWKEIDGRETLVLVCEWAEAGDSCGQPPVLPACTRGHVGATFRFPDETKECRCNDDGCYWF